MGKKLQAATSPRQKKHTDLVELAVELHDRALAARNNGRYGEALALGTQALELLKTELGPNQPDVANVLNLLGAVHSDRAEYAQAEKRYRQAVGIMSRIPSRPGRSPDVERVRAQSLTGLGNVVRARGRDREAERLLKRALTIAERAFGRDDVEVSSVLNNLAVVYKYSAKFAAASRLYRRARVLC